jgi:hypothetical protein
MPGMWWWVWVGAGLALAVAYLGWLGSRAARLHRRADAAGAALDAALVRRAAAAAVLAERLADATPHIATDLYATARTCLDTEPDEREAAENALTRALRRLPGAVAVPIHGGLATMGNGGVEPVWSNLVTASRRVALARQVHTDVVRDALIIRRRIPVRLFGLVRRFPEPAYFDVDDPGLDGQVSTRPAVSQAEDFGGGADEADGGVATAP